MSGQSLVRGITKNDQNRCSFFRMNVHISCFHPVNMPGSHPLSATFVWPIEMFTALLPIWYLVFTDEDMNDSVCTEDRQCTSGTCNESYLCECDGTAGKKLVGTKIIENISNFSNFSKF